MSDIQNVVSAQYETIIRRDGQIVQVCENIISLKEKLKSRKEAYKGMLEQDAEYSEIKQLVDMAKKKLAARKEELDRNEGAQTLKNEIAQLQSEKKLEQLTLSDYLLNYVDETHGSTTIEVKGEVKKIQREAKISL